MNKNHSNNEMKITDTIGQAQSDISKGYADGSVGMIVSGLIWLTSAFVSFQFSDKQAVWALLIGGMFIYPLSVLLCKLMELFGQLDEYNLNR